MILNNKNTWICNSCYTVNSSSSKKCMICGNKNPNQQQYTQGESTLYSVGGITNPQQPHEIWFCPICGKRNIYNFCPVCGTKNPNI